MSSSSSSSNSSQRRQMLQPWPVCLMFANRSKEKHAGPGQYARVPTTIPRTGTTSSSLVSDCASNSTLVTNASPFNSQLTLTVAVDGTTSPSFVEKDSPLPSPDHQHRNHQLERPHYYAENLRNQNQALGKAQLRIPYNGDDDDDDAAAAANDEEARRRDPTGGVKTAANASGRGTELGDEDEDEDEESADPRYKQFDRLLVEHDRDALMDAQELRGGQTPTKPPYLTYQFQKEPQPMVSTYYWTQILAALSVSIGSMVVGFSSSYTSPALLTMKNETSLEMTTDKESWVAGIMPLSALLGGVIGGPLIEYLGRRNTILATGAPFSAAWILIALATNFNMVLAGRALTGFCVGIASLSLPVYLGETIQPEVRGTLGLLPTAFGNIGILVCFVAGMYLDWSNLAFLGASIPVPFMILMFLIPETPRWFISKGNADKARRSLQWLRGKRTDVSAELAAVEKTHVESERTASRGALKELLKKSYAKPLFISLGLMFFQQMSGINAVIFYTVDIFQSAGSTIDKNISTIIVGIVNFLSTFMATMLIDRLGRKILLYVSSVSMIVSLVALGVFFHLKKTGFDVDPIGWLPLASFIVYIIGFSLGFGPIPWLMMGEILPAKVRGSAASIVTAFNWFCTFIVTKTFKDVIDAIGNDGTFWMFSIVVLVGLGFVIVFVPETRGRSLEEIEMRLTGPVRRMSAVANIKPLPTAC